MKPNNVKIIFKDNINQWKDQQWCAKFYRIEILNTSHQLMLTKRKQSIFTSVTKDKYEDNQMKHS